MKKLFKLLVLSAFLTSAINVSAQTVYVNKADSKYHLLSCRFLDPSHDSLDMSLAIKKGLAPCSVCEPSSKSKPSSGSMGTSGSMSNSNSMGAMKSMEKSGMKQQMNSSANTAGQQCAVINKDGKRCIGTAEPGSIYCYEHRNYKK
jgi:tricorn protease-like protein